MSQRVDVDETDDDRFARFKLIGWWDQEKLRNAKILLIGVGALGNEILKNLALLGVGRVVVVDLDRIAYSNLSRSVLFRAEDIGERKVDVAARRAVEIYPDMRVRPLSANVVYDLGQGVYRWADVILGGLDNREARVAINRQAARVGKTWIDGAIERLDGVARVFNPSAGPCYECTMSETDWKMLEARRSCALLTRQEMEAGKVPTTPTTSAVVAGIQTQEAVKLLHGLDTIAGKGFVFDGTYHQSYLVEYSRKADCPSHDIQEPLEVLSWSVRSATAGQLLEKARADLGPLAIVEFNHDLLSGLSCDACDSFDPIYASLGKITEDQARCPLCQAHRTPSFYHVIDGSDEFMLDLTLAELGLPPWDVVTARVGDTMRCYELAGDLDEVLGDLRHDTPKS